jgi:hypothetical protein
MASKYPLKIDVGTTFSRIVTWREKRLDGTIVRRDLTGYTALLQIKNRVGGTVLIELTNASGIQLQQVEDSQGSALGTIKFLITDEQTVNLKNTEGTYDLLLSAPSGERYRLLEGKVTFRPAVSKPS